MGKAIVRNEPSLSDVVAKAEGKGWELEDVSFGDIAICHSCSEILLLDDEAYESHDGNILCSSCSVLCEACDQYFTEEEMVHIEGCESSSGKVCEACHKEDDLRLVANNTLFKDTHSAYKFSWRGEEEETISEDHKEELKEIAIEKILEKVSLGDKEGILNAELEVEKRNSLYHKKIISYKGRWSALF